MPRDTYTAATPFDTTHPSFRYEEAEHLVSLCASFKPSCASEGNLILCIIASKVVPRRTDSALPTAPVEAKYGLFFN